MKIYYDENIMLIVNENFTFFTKLINVNIRISTYSKEQYPLY